MPEQKYLTLLQIAKIVKGKLVGEDKIVKEIGFYPIHGQKTDLLIIFKNAEETPECREWIAKTDPGALLIHKPLNLSIPYIQVPSVLKASQLFATWWRKKFTFPVIGITGSSGKTSTRQLLANILRERFNVLENPENANDIHAISWLTLCMNPSHQVAVLEMGAHFPTNIADMTKLIKPNITIITNINASHVATIGNLDAIAREKGALIEGIQPNGIAIINADDSYAEYFKTKAKAAGAQIITFGINNKADIMARSITLTSSIHPHFELVFTQQSIPIKLQLIGKHQVYNALAASAAAAAMGMSIFAIRNGLKKTLPYKRRLLRYNLQGATIIDDTYNASWGSVEAAINVLAEHKGNKVLILGDMNDLGEYTQIYHEEAGKLAREKGINKIYGIGNDTPITIDTFGNGGLQLSDKDKLLELLDDDIKNKSTLLFKGRFQGYENPMFRIIKELEKKFS